MAATKAPLLLAVLCLFLVSEVCGFKVFMTSSFYLLQNPLIILLSTIFRLGCSWLKPKSKDQIAGQSVHRGAASHGSRRCAYRHAPHAATPARDVCLQALQLARRCALAMPNTRRAGALEL
ncbi:hypothetical protein V6N13_012496 [Hibiscus sabdariffa]|uniref:Uncharacterized protein n=1 Tax=Hibiscus sabdariffa TaxID=183260 RepID=A0ABR2SFL4_9ROSI